MKCYLPFVIIAGVALITLGTGRMLYVAKQRAASASAGSPEQISVGQPGAQPPRVRGEANAAVTVEEFGDFECPPCAGLSRALAQIKQDYGARLRLIFRHSPLAKHQHALAAAYAAEAAGLQNRFREMHDLLYQHQASWHAAGDPRPLFNSYAALLRLDVERFRTDAASEQVKARVAADRGRAASLDVTETPTLFLNGRKLPSTFLPPDRLRVAIDATINGKPAF